MKSPLYWSGWFYGAGMQVMHGRSLHRRYHHIARFAEDSVLDVGCGTGKLMDHLPESCRYLGIDLNEDFLRHGLKRGRNVMKQDALTFDRYDEFDVCVVMDVLHHITPHHEEFMDRVLQDVKKRVIICEPFAIPGRNPVMKRLIRMADNDGINKQEEEWMDKPTLIDFYGQYDPSRIDQVGQAMIAVYEK